MNEEITKDIEGYNGDYSITNFGKVVSNKFGKTKVLKPGINANGIYQVVLCKDGGERTFNVHRLVVTHFKPEIADYFCIIHSDGDRGNNHVDNLVQCADLSKVDFENIKANQFHTANPRMPRAVTIFDPVDDVTYTVHSMYRAAKILGVSMATMYNACNGKQSSVKGLIVNYADQPKHTA